MCVHPKNSEQLERLTDKWEASHRSTRALSDGKTRVL